MKVEILDASVSFVEQTLVKPLVLSTGPIARVTEARAEVTVRADGRRATGCGSIYLSDLWAWPDPALSHAERDAALRRLCGTIAGDLAAMCGGEAAHPLALGMRLHHAVCEGEQTRGIPSVLARAMCASPFDAAVHDAAGIALGCSAFGFYGDPVPMSGVDRFFEGRSACAAIREMLRPPQRTFDAWWVVGKDDSLRDDVGPAVRKGYRCFKLKVMGRDNAADAARTVEVYRAVTAMGTRNPRLTVDSNEGNPDADSVLDYLARLREADGEAFEALAYLEQPTGRDITVDRYDWREVTRLKPVMLDEGLTSLALLDEAASQGWSGLALKTCKGHSFALVAAAWARQRGLLLSLQDLTNPGLAAIHAALFAAHVPMINGVELNSPQYTPDANAAWLPRLSGLFEPADGVHRLPDAVPVGLGSVL